MNHFSPSVSTFTRDRRSRMKLHKLFKYWLPLTQEGHQCSSTQQMNTSILKDTFTIHTFSASSSHGKHYGRTLPSVHTTLGPSPTLPARPASHRSRTTDQSLGPYVVMSCSLRVKRRGLSRPSAPLCGTFHCFNICMVVRQTIKPNLSPPRGGGGGEREEREREWGGVK